MNSEDTSKPTAFITRRTLKLFKELVEAFSQDENDSSDALDELEEELDRFKT